MHFLSKARIIILQKTITNNSTNISDTGYNTQKQIGIILHIKYKIDIYENKFHLQT